MGGLPGVLVRSCESQHVAGACCTKARGSQGLVGLRIRDYFPPAYLYRLVGHPAHDCVAQHTSVCTELLGRWVGAVAVGAADSGS